MNIILSCFHFSFFCDEFVLFLFKFLELRFILRNSMLFLFKLAFHLPHFLDFFTDSLFLCSLFFHPYLCVTFFFLEICFCFLDALFVCLYFFLEFFQCLRT